ncbi:MAG: hypothetical protein KKF12_21945 [Proteobacteria bacterium]|nr:hypothetical protein [Pseudomonadota bacterium]
MEKEKRLTFTIPEELHTKFKIFAAQEKATMKDLIIGFIKEAVKEESNKK